MYLLKFFLPFLVLDEIDKIVILTVKWRNFSSGFACGRAEL